MSDKISINQITNASVYVDGDSFLGRAEEVELPGIKAKMNDIKALGLFGSIETPAGLEKMEAKIKWNSLYTEVLEKSGNPFKAISLQIRGSLETYNSLGRTEEKSAVAFMTGFFKEGSGGSFKQQEPVTQDSTLAINYYKLTVDGEDIYEIDVMANIYKINGEDILANYRANLGDGGSIARRGGSFS